MVGLGMGRLRPVAAGENGCGQRKKIEYTQNVRVMET